MKQKLRILTVEDDFLVGEKLRSMLEDLGHTIVGEATNGLEAVRLAGELGPDMILMDVDLPRMDGLTAAKIITEQSPTPIVALTAHETADLVGRAGEAGVGYYLIKPAQPRELERAMTIAQARFDDMMALRHLNAQLERRVRELSALNRLARLTTAVLDIPTILQRTTEEMVHLFQASEAAITLIDGDQFRVATHHSANPDCASLVDVTIPFSERSMDIHLVKSGQPVVLSQIQTDPHMNPIAQEISRKRDIYSVMGVPLRSRGENIGAIWVASDRPDREFTPAERALGQTMAGQLSGAIDNARLFAETEQAREAAEEANRIKSTFLANMSHELRTPLNVILGYAQLLQTDPRQEADMREQVDTIYRSGEHLLSLINEVLDLAKIEAGRMELHPAECVLPQFLADIVDMFAFRAERKKLAFHYEADPALPYSVTADERQLRQILLNLLGNALKFTEAGYIRFRVACLSQTEQSCRLRFEVEDTGPGISAEDQAAIFEPFWQIEERAALVEGTGLGLSISQRLADLMGSRLQLRSVEGEGSLFWFELALPVESASPPPDEEAAEESWGRVAGGPYRVLVIDDQAENRLFLQESLESAGFETREAANGQAGLALAETFRPDLILTDIYMPELDGLELTRRLRQLPQGEEAVIIAISASAFQEEEADSLAAGCDDFIAKPIRLAELWPILTEHLDLEWVETESRPAAEPPDQKLQELPLPPPEELADLYEVAMNGDIRGILDYAAHLEQIGEAYRPFADKLAKLARAYQVDLIQQFVAELSEQAEGD